MIKDLLYCSIMQRIVGTFVFLILFLMYQSPILLQFSFNFYKTGSPLNFFHFEQMVSTGSSALLYGCFVLNDPDEIVDFSKANFPTKMVMLLIQLVLRYQPILAFCGLMVTFVSCISAFEIVTRALRSCRERHFSKNVCYCTQISFMMHTKESFPLNNHES
jgi:hypothetical protein